MKLVSFLHDGVLQGGILDDYKVHPLPPSRHDPVLAFITSGETLHPADNSPSPLEGVTLLAPLQHPPRIFGIGLNYREHAAESKMAVQAVPTVFLKLGSSITGPNTDVLLPADATQPDYEAELAVVIGKPGHRIAAADWEQHVFG